MFGIAIKPWSTEPSKQVLFDSARSGGDEPDQLTEPFASIDSYSAYHISVSPLSRRHCVVTLQGCWPLPRAKFEILF